MTAFQLLAPLPIVTLDAGCTITVEAIDPASGSAVTGVVVTQVAIYASNAVPGPTPPERSVLFAYAPVLE